jgi:ferric-dicitrate binding protein FerR (iron transport regulator)
LQSVGWTQNKFSFIGVPLADVVKEVERQYDIHVSTTSELDYLYTGNFSKEKQPEEVLEIIGKPFGITFKIEL